MQATPFASHLKSAGNACFIAFAFDHTIISCHSLSLHDSAPSGDVHVDCVLNVLMRKRTESLHHNL